MYNDLEKQWMDLSGEMPESYLNMSPEILEEHKAFIQEMLIEYTATNNEPGIRYLERELILINTDPKEYGRYLWRQNSISVRSLILAEEQHRAKNN